ncbi:hypothetical protein P154DRAFT_572660 [Amniculicola lignicola CBS 123094]|uniref:Uncharacterized protein n=1 Tax=Amniculicola lignicola CBS 123094 TaxID=1392246 RepID=A0A6A5WRX5_9PLEO|nr:hypothetical protein P154DRAFT_572660 [Amniculicola lignicola CBS 123094]
MSLNSDSTKMSTNSGTSHTSNTSISNIHFIEPLEPATSLDTIRAAPVTWLDHEVKAELLVLTKKLLQYDLECELWDPEDYDPFSVSLSMLEDRLRNGQFGPPASVSGSKSPSPADISNLRANIHKRTGKRAQNRPLEEFQDLYHALVAKVKDLHSQICVQVNNGFMRASGEIWYQGPTLEWFADELVEYWDILNDPEVVQPLDDAVRRANVKDLHTQMIDDHYAGKLSADDLEELSEYLYEEEKFAGIAGLVETSGWAPAMIRAWLTEKYHVLLRVEQDAEEEIARKEKEEKRRHTEFLAEAARKRKEEIQRKMEAQREATRKLAEEQKREAERAQEVKMRIQADQQLRRTFEEMMAETREKMQREREVREFRAKAKRVEEYGRQLRAFCAGSERGGSNTPTTPPAWWVYRIDV